MIDFQEIARKYVDWERVPHLNRVVNAYKRFFIWVFTKDEYITGIEKDDFILACNDYLTESPAEYKAQLQKILFLQSRKSPTLADHNQARANWIREHWSVIGWEFEIIYYLISIFHILFQ